MATTTTRKTIKKSKTTLDNKKDTLNSLELAKVMKDKTRCSECGKILTTELNFYISNSNMYKATGRVTLCKDCVRKYLVDTVKKDNNNKIAIYKMCSKLDLCFKESIYSHSVDESKVIEEISNDKNVLSIWSKYIKNLNSLGITNNGYISYEDGDFLNLHSQGEEENSFTIDTVSREEELEKIVLYKQNKKDAIRMLGYDPFETEVEKDKPKLYSKLIKMLNEDITEDGIKTSAILNIIRTQQQHDKIDDTISVLNKDIKNIVDNITTIKSLTTIKKELSNTIVSMAKENKLVEGRVAGANSLTAKEKKLKELDLEAIQVNMFDQQTSLGMQQVASISMKASISNLNFGDETLSEMVGMQRKMIDDFRIKYLGLKEENRRLKILCTNEDVDYKEYLVKEEWTEELQFDKDEVDKKLEDIEQKEKAVEPITIDQYADRIIEEKKEKEKKKLLNSVKKK